MITINIKEVTDYLIQKINKRHLDYCKLFIFKYIFHYTNIKIPTKNDVLFIITDFIIKKAVERYASLYASMKHIKTQKYIRTEKKNIFGEAICKFDPEDGRQMQKKRFKFVITFNFKDNNVKCNFS